MPLPASSTQLFDEAYVSQMQPEGKALSLQTIILLMPDVEAPTLNVSVTPVDVV